MNPQRFSPPPLLSLTWLHLLPGLLGLALALALHPVVQHFSWPGGVALLGSLVGLVCYYAIALLLEGKRQTGRRSLTGAVTYLKPLPLWQLLGLAILLIGWTLLSVGMLAPVDLAIKKIFFNWTPGWFSMDLATLPAEIRLPALAIYLVFGVLLGPVLQELYFRGWLLPRLESLKWAGPLLNTVLFAATHFYEPWSWLSLSIAFLPVAYLVKRKQNVVLAIVVHCLLNLLSASILFGLLPNPAAG